MMSPSLMSLNLSTLNPHSYPDATSLASSLNLFNEDKVDSNIKATLLGDDIGLNLYTSSSGLQVYSCNFPNTDIKLDRGEFETQYSSITLEEVNAPYSLDSMLIKANETYVRIHKYEFFKKGE